MQYPDNIKSLIEIPKVNAIKSWLVDGELLHKKDMEKNPVPAYAITSVESKSHYIPNKSRKTGSKDFQNDMMRLVRLYQPLSVTVELWNGLSPNARRNDVVTIDFKDPSERTEPDPRVDEKMKETENPMQTSLIRLEHKFELEQLKNKYEKELIQNEHEIERLKEEKERELKEKNETIKDLEAEIEELEEELADSEEEISLSGHNHPNREGLTIGGVYLPDLMAAGIKRVLVNNPKILTVGLGIPDEQVKNMFLDEETAGSPPKQIDESGFEPSKETENIPEEKKKQYEVASHITGYLKKLSEAEFKRIYALLLKIQSDPPVLNKIFQFIRKEASAAPIVTEPNTQNDA